MAIKTHHFSLTQLILGHQIESKSW